MEDLPPWPASIFDSDQTTLEMTKTGLAVTKNTQFASTVKKWRAEAESLKLDIDSATEEVQMELTSAREFLDVQTLTETRATELKTKCEEHSRTMSDT